ncbi:MAG: class I SAM-dependent methyltransferase [Burkholderiales bacterium]|nr:class I SAM-dependent methyltransferase [Burkholderiales bacterium]
MREFWDTRYNGDLYLFGTEPNAFLASQKALFEPGQHVLAVADGEGRNGVWLASQGLDVLSVDFSGVAQEKARKLAGGLPVRFEIADLTAWDWGVERFDAIVAIFIQFTGPLARKKMFGDMKAALKSGGLLILEGYTPRQLEYKTGGPSQIENLYTEELLREAFSDFDILHLEAFDSVVEEGAGHSGRSALIDLVARKR